MISIEDKIDFVFQVALKLAEKEDLLPLYDLWKLEVDLTAPQFAAVSAVLAGFCQQETEKVSYPDIEDALVKAGYTKEHISKILGILYADQVAGIVQLMNRSTDKPPELKKFIKKLK